jgi:hypothetical protein
MLESLVRTTGVEPVWGLSEGANRQAPAEPKPAVYTDFTTSACSHV